MNPYRYTVSLRIVHPTMDPNSITDNLNISPSRKWKAGEQRRTPKGDQLQGKYEESYWTAHLSGEAHVNSEQMALEEYIQHMNERLHPFASYFEKINNDGGGVEYYIGIFCDSNIGIELPPYILKSTYELGITISMDIYPEKNEEVT